MKQASAILPFDMKRLALLAALLLVLRFMALDLHHAVADHQVDEPCELCLVVERGGNAVAQVTTPLPPRLVIVTAAFPALLPPALAAPWLPPPRGPPASLS
jgi:hypothetical protein